MINKQVPLVFYKRGVRTVIGMAIVKEDGSIEAQVTKDHWSQITDIIQPPGSISFSPNVEVAVVPSINPKLHPDAPKI